MSIDIYKPERILKFQYFRIVIIIKRLHSEAESIVFSPHYSDPKRVSEFHSNNMLTNMNFDAILQYLNDIYIHDLDLGDKAKQRLIEKINEIGEFIERREYDYRPGGSMMELGIMLPQLTDIKDYFMELSGRLLHFTPQPIAKKKPEMNETLISFSSPKIINKQQHPEFGKLKQHIAEQLEYIERINKVEKALPPQPIIKQEPEPKETKLSKKIRKHFGFMLENCPRKGKPILNNVNDIDNLVEWITYYFENNFKVPEISEPIKSVNTNVYFTQLAFLYLFDELRKSGYHTQRTRAKTLFNLWESCFADYKGYSEKNFWKVKHENGKEVRKLMLID